MKKCFLLFLGISIIALSSSAQDCTNESILQKPGIWKESSGGSTSGIDAADLAREKKVVAAIHTMIKSKYSPISVKADFGGAYNRSYPDMSANSYYYRIMPLNFYCEGNTLKIEDETSTDFEISANGFDAEIYESPNNDEVASGTGYNYIQDMPVEKDGYWYFKEKDVTLGFGIPGKESEWLITYDGKLPFEYVTKKEFLETQKKIVANAVHMSAAGDKDVLDKIEIEKGFKVTEFKNDPEKLTKYMKMDYLPTKERYEKLLTDNEKNFKPVFDKLEEQLKLPAAELNQQAIVKQDPHSASLYLFTDDSDGSGHVLIKPNPAYFNKKLPRSSPQFFWVNVTWNHNEPIATKFNEDILKAVDFTTLKNMLGK